MRTKKRAKPNTRADTVRLYEILKLMTLPFSSEDMDFLSMDQKLEFVVRPEENPIYRRKIIDRLPIIGMWWMDEEQWTRFLWAGYDGHVIKSDQDPDRVLATRSFEPKGFCYVRERGDWIDLEGMVKGGGWDKEKKKAVGTIYEWLTVTISRYDYELLAGKLGPIDQGCKHG